MKPKDFKLLAALPEEYDYEIMKLNSEEIVVGRKDSTIIAFSILNDELVPIKIRGVN